ncbi:hypothetical protein BaRGS_00001475, partial [Batillaria attramentaria]
VPLTFTKDLQDVEVPEEDTIILECELSKKGKPVKWMKDGVEIVPGGRIEVVYDRFCHQLIIEDATLEDMGRYSCVCEDVSTSCTVTVEVTEGQPFTLECEVSKPNLKARWLKDGKEISPSDHCRLIVDGPVHRLEIPQASLDDEADYTIEVRDKSSKAMVLVEEIPLEILTPLSDQTVVEHEPFTFTCQVSKPNTKARWLKDGQEVKLADGFEIAVDGQTHTLVKKDASLEDKGKYTVVVEQKSSSANLGVSELPTTFVRPLANITVTENQKLALECEVSRPDKPAQWFKDDIPVTASARIKLKSEGGVHSLVIDSAELDDEAVYKVVVNGVESTAEVLVEELPTTFVRPLANITVTEHQKLALECEVSRPDKPVQWFKDDVPVTASARIRLKSEGGVHSLVIDSAELDDEAVYKAVVNGVESSAEVLVEELPTTFIRPLANITVTEHQKLSLECEVSRPDKPAQWFKDNVPVTASARIRLKSEGGVHSLVIDSAELDDEAVYKVIVNGVESTAEVLVEEEPVEFIRKLKDVEVTEMETAVFKCEVSKAGLKAKWMYNGKPVTAKDGFDVKVDKTVHTLTIEDVALEDAGTFSVKFDDKESEGKLIVRELPVEFTKPLKDIEVMENTPITLTCEVNKPDKAAKWQCNGKDLVPSDHIQITADGCTHTLTIPAARLEDEAVYKCMVGDRKTSGRVSVKEEPLSFVKPLSDQTVMEYQPITLECTVSKPDRPATWYKDGAKLTPSDRLKITAKDKQHTLTIDRAAPDDEAEYSIKVDDFTSKCIVLVEEEEVEFVRKLEDIDVLEIPGTVTFECEVNKVNTVAEWFFKEQPITASDKYELESKGVIHRLTIKEVDGRDEGDYKVVVKGKKSEAGLFVEVAPQIFIDKKYDETIYLYAGQSTAFEVPFTGNPQPKVAWTFNDGDLPDKKRMEAETIYNMTTVRMSHVQRGDTGNYTVTLANDNGKAVITIKLVVLDKPSPPREVTVKDITAETATITWQTPEDDGGKPITQYVIERREASRRTWNKIGDTTTLELPVAELVENNQYIFRVFAQNDVGLSEPTESDTITAKNPFGVPDAPEAPTVSDVFHDSAVVSWQPPANDGGSPVTGYTVERQSSFSPRWVAVNKSPVPELSLKVDDLIEDNSYQFRVIAHNKAGPSQPSQPSPNILAKDPWTVPSRPGTPDITGTDKSSVALKWAPPESDGGSPITNYVVQYRPSGTTQWIRANETMTVPDTTFSVTGLKENAEYEFRVAAENRAGVGEASSPTKPVKVIKPIVGEPPMLREPLKDLTVVAPGDAILECDIDVGEPEAEIKWYRGKKEVKKSAKYEMSYEDEVAALVIHKTEPEDADVYRCEATNPLGRVQTEGTLSVHTHPTLEYDNRLKSAQTVRAGTTLVLTVNISGIPSPSVAWFIDDEPLQKSDRISIETTEEYSTLTVKNTLPDDTGLYTICAENVVGKAEADFEINIKDKPGKPNNLHAIEVLKDQIVLAWEPPTSTGNCPLKGYVIEKRDAKRNTWMPVQTVDSTTVTYAVQKLLEGNEYFFRVAAENEIGVGEAAELFDGIVAKSPYDVPDAPKKLQPSEITRSSVTLTWEPPESDGGSVITGYTVERKSPTSSRWTRVNKSPIRDTVYTVMDLVEGSEYEFRVIAENAAGLSKPSEPTGIIKAVDPYNKPDAPGKPEAIDVTKESITLKWLPPDNDGGNAIFNYVVEMRVSGSSRWLAASQNLKVPDTSFTVRELVEGTDYEFRVSAENKAGVGPPSPSSGPITAREPILGEAPTVLEGLPDLAVMEGDTTVFECKISGEPVPSIKWMKEQREILEDKRHSMVYDNNVASLTIRDTTQKDAGSYTCEASNDLGTVTTSGVLEIQAAPTLEFDNKFRDLISLHVGATLKIPVKVSGIPTPRITWAKEEGPLKSGGRITISVQEDSTTLTVKKVTKDEDGLITLTADNHVGEAKAKFDVEVLDVPSAPQGPLEVSDITADSAVLHWKPPKDDGGIDLTGYIIERRDTKRAVWTKVGSVDGVTLDYKVTGLQEGTEYLFRVSAENEVGISEPLERDMAVVPKSPFDKPSPPEGPIVISDVTADSATLAWKPPKSDGGSPLTGYVIERRDVRKTTWTKVASVDAQTLTCTATKLLEGTPYLFRVMAVNKEGTSLPLESEEETIPKKPAEVPGKPVGPIKFSQILADSVTLAWSPPKKDGGSPVASYTVELTDDGGKTWRQMDSVEAKVTLYTAKGLTEDQEYKFRVCAVNSVGASEPLVSDAVVPKRKIEKPSKPEGPLEATDVQRDSVTLQWKPPKDDGGSPLTAYIIEKRDAKRGSWTKAGKVDGDVTEFRVADLIEKTDYHFRVSAVNKAGQSEPLETDKPITVKSPFDVPGKPKGPLEINNVTDKSADLTWKPPESDGGTPLTGYIIEVRPDSRSTWTKAGNVDGATTSFTVPDLREGQEYHFRVMAVNAEGQSAPLESKETAKPTKKILPPGSPRDLRAARVGEDYVTLEWKAPTDDGGAKITNYRIEKCEETSEEWIKIEDIKSFDTVYKVTGLKENVGYYFSVSAKNQVGFGEPAETDAAIKPKKPEGPPGAPTAPLTASDIDKTSVTLSWKPPTSDGGSPLTGYILERRESTRTSWTKLDKIGPDTLTYKAVNLIEGSDYYFRVSAENKHGVSSPLEMDKTVKPKSPFDVPGKPKGPLEINNVTDKSADLTWKPPESDGGTPLTGYIIEVRPDSRSTWTKAGSVDGTTTSFTVPDLKEGQEYHFRVMAVNAEGQSAPLESKETAKPTKKLLPPGPPRDVRPGRVGADYVTLEWKPPAEDGGAKVTHYRIEKCEETSEEWIKIEDIKSFDTVYKVTGLKENVGYYFSVSAKNQVGFGEPAETDAAIKPKKPEGPPGPPSAPFSVSDVDKTSVTLSWKPPTDDGGSPLTGYILERREATRTSWTKLEKIGADLLTYKAVNLMEGSEYYFRVSAENKHGVSSPLEMEKTVKPKSPFDVPGKPKGPLEINSVTDKSADLTWKPPESDGGTPLTGYIIEVRPDSRSTWTKAGSVDGTTTSFTVPDLKEGQEYHFRVMAVNAEGQSAPLESKETAKPTKKLLPPGPPRDVRPGRVGADYVTLEWKPPAEDGGAKVTHYRIEKCEETSEEWIKIEDIKSFDTVYKVTGLKENVGYYFSVSAKNQVGFGEPAETDAAIKPKKPEGPPGPPTAPLNATDIDRTSVTLSWKPPTDDGGSPLTGYILERRESTRTSWTKLEKIKPDLLTYKAVNLIEGSEYYFRVTAENKHGVSSPLETEKTVKPKSPFDVPSKPKGPMEVSNVTETSADLTWKPPESDGGTPLTGYIIEVRPDSRSTWTKAGSVDGATTSFTVPDLREGQEYHFRVMAVNAEGQSAPLEAFDTAKPAKKIVPPGPPEGLHAARVGADYVTLEWLKPDTDGGAKVTHYRIEKCEETSEKWVKVEDIKSLDTAYKVTGLKENVGYYFSVSAKNQVGFGEPAETDAAIKPKKPEEKPGPPTGPLVVTDVDLTSATLTWKPPKEDGGSPITGYIVERKETTKSKWTRLEHLDADTLTFKATNLLDSYDYHFRVFAQNKVGLSEPLDTERAIKPQSPFKKPTRPTGPMTVDNVTETTADLTWKPPESDGGTPLTSYIIEVRPESRSTWTKAGSVDGTTTSFTVPDLKDGQEYHFRVIAVNAEGQSPPLEAKDTAKPVKKITPPGPPTNLRISKVGPDFITLEWKAPAEDGGSKITGYKFEICDEKSDDWVKVADLKAYDTSYKVTNLKETVGYLFAVSAQNTVGYSEPCETERAIKPKRPEGPPSKPVGPLKAKDIEQTSVTLEWQPPTDDGGSPLTGYILEKRDTSRPTWARVEKLSPNKTSYKVLNLLEGAEYHFRVSAENKHGTSEPLETEKTVTPKSPYDKPSKPVGPIKFSDIKQDSVTLTWQAPDSDGGLPLKNYIIEYRDARRTTWMRAGTVGKDTTTFTCANLTEGNEYTFRVIAVNDEGESPPLESKETVKPQRELRTPSSPATISVKDVGKDFVTVDWTAPKDNGGSKVTGYTILYREERTDEWKKAGSVGSLETSFTVKGLSLDKKYYFAVAAENKQGQGERVETDTPVAPKKPLQKPAPPEGPITFTDIQRTSVTFTWKPSPNDGGSPITAYILERREVWKMTWTPMTTVKPDITSYCVQNLKEGTEYFFRVIAENAVGKSEPLESDGVTPKSPYAAPAAPEGPLEASDTTATSITFTWKPPKSDGGKALSGYVIECRDSRRLTWSPLATVPANVTSYCAEKLLTNNEYFFRVMAENTEGKSAPLENSKPFKPVRAPELPAAPSGPLQVNNLTADSASLLWAAPPDDGGSDLTQYIVEVSVDGGEWTKLGKVDSYSTKFRCQNLKTNAKHVFRVSAVNSVGTSKPLESEAVTPKRPPEAPGKPVGPLEAIDIQRNSITIRWKPPTDDGGSPLTGYVVEQREAKRMMWTKVTTVKPDITTYQVQKLAEGTEYLFRVSAVNKEGTSKPLESDVFTAKSPFDKPSAPAGPLSVSNLTEDSADLEWKAPQSDGGSPLTRYYIEMRDVRRSTWTKVGEVQPTVTKFTVKKLSLDNEYLFRVVAVNAEGDSPPLSTSTPVAPVKKLGPPSQPESIHVRKVGKNFADLEWTPPKSDGGAKITNYRVYKSTVLPPVWEEVAKVKGFETTYTVGDLVEGKEYLFSVAAENEVGKGNVCETEMFIKAAKPLEKPSAPEPPLEVVDHTRESLTLSWGASESDGGTPILHYVLERREGWKTTWTHVAKVKPEGQKLTHCVQNLKEGQDYYFRVYAENSVGTSRPIETETSVKPRSPFKVPSPPEGPIVFEEITATSVVVRWKASRDTGGLAITAYYLERRDKKYTSWIKVDKTKPNVTSYCVQNLLEGNEYFFRVFAENEEGMSAPLESLQSVIPHRPPVAPSVPTGPVRFKDIQETSVVLDWLPPKDDGGTPITGYAVQMSEAGEDFVDLGQTDGKNTKMKVKDLKTGVKYIFRVSAVNKVGSSKPLESDSVVPKRPPEPPSKPQGPIKVLSTTKTSATIEWRPPEDDGGLPLTAYILEKREFPRTTWSRVDKISPDITSYCVQSLTTGSDYFFRVSAENKAGVSPPLEMDKPVRIKSPYDVPSAPVGPLRVTNVTDKSADIAWNPPDSDGGTPITGYIVQTRIIPRSTFTTVEQTLETSVTLTGLVPDNQYMVQIIAVNAEGQSLPLAPREPICPQRILSVPDAPASINVRGIMKDGLTLEWTPPESDGGSKVRRYIVEMSIKGTDKWERIAAMDYFRNQHMVSDLQPEKDYLFAVSAENDVGVSERQKTQKAIRLEKPILPPSPPTGPLVISDVTKRSARITWKAPESDGGSPITYYTVEKRETWKTSWTPVERVPGDRLTYELVHLQEGQDFFVRVKAENVAGQSKPLESDEPITPKSPYNKPSAPESLTATDVTETTVSLQWRPPTSDGGLPIKTYIVERRDKRWGSWVKAGTTKGTVTTMDVEHLMLDQEYFFRVSAENEEGVGPATEMKESVIPTREPVAPEAPGGPVYFSHIEATSVVLEWRSPRDNGGAPVTGYRVEISQTQDTWTEVTITEGDVTKIKAKDLTTDQKYYFRIFAINKAGTSKPLVSDAVTPKRPVGLPSKPVGPLEATAVTRDSVTLEWKPPKDDGGSPITGYVIEKREATRTTWARADKTTDDKTTRTLKGLIEGDEFYFRVAAVNRQGTSEFLEMPRPVVIKSPYDVPSPPKGPLKILRVTEDSAELEWGPSEYDGGTPILQYAIEIRESRRTTWGRAGVVDALTTRYTARSLVINNEYSFRIRAINAEGMSQPLDGEETVVPRKKTEAPRPPAAVHISKTTEDSVTLEWRPPTNDGGARIKTYHIQVKEDTPAATWKDAGTVEAFKTQFAVKGLETDKKYKFAVLAENEIGLSEQCVADKSAAPKKSVKPPSPPQEFQVSELRRDSVVVSWKHSKDDGGSPITNYIVEKRESWKTSWAHVDRVRGAVTSSEVMYLQEGTSYSLRVMAENVAGLSEPTELEEPVIPKSPYKVPSAPVGPLEVTSVDSQSVTLKWLSPEKDGGLPVKRYIVERREAKRQAWVKGETVRAPTTTCTIERLMEGSHYVFRVIAENDEGLSPPLESDAPVTCRRAPEKPGPPSGKLRASKITQDTVTLDWLPPLDDGGSPLTAFIIEAKDSKAKDWSTVAEVNPESSRHTVKNLKEGEDYQFRICAQNAIGRSKPVEMEGTVKPSRPIETPGAPRGPLVAKNEGRDSVSLSWQPPLDDGGSPITGYIVDKLDVQRGGWVRAARVAAGVTSHTLSGLTTGHDYNFRVYAENKAGVGQPLDLKTLIKAKSAYNVPTPPRDFKATDIQQDSVMLQWSPPESNGGLDLLGYVVERREVGRQQWSRVGQTNPDVLTIKARNLLEGRPYTFRVMAENPEGLSEPAMMLKPITPERPIEPPGPPQDLECTDIDKESVTLAWKKPLKEGGMPVLSYIIEKREGKAASWTRVADTGFATHVYNVDGLIEGYEYYFQVRAKNAAGIGEPATLKSPVIPAKRKDKPSAPVGPLECVAVTEDSVTLSWQPPESNGGSPLTGYIIEKSDVRRPKWLRVDKVSPDQTKATVERLLENVGYFFRVVAENKVGVSPPLENEIPFKPKCPYGPPSRPQAPIKTLQITRDSATIQWLPPSSDGGAPLTGYVVERREEGRRGWMYCGRTDADATILTCPALTENTQYFFRVYAENKYGRSEPLESEFPVIPKRVFDKPSAPENLRAENIDKDSLTLAWTPPPDDDGSIKRYIIEKRAADSKTWEPVTDVSGRTKWFMVKGLPPGGSFFFRVKAENPAGVSAPAELSVPVELKTKKEKPKAPKEAPVIQELGTDFVELIWSPPEVDGGSPITGYQLERMDISGRSWLPVNKEPITDTRFRVPDLKEGLQYEFRVKAQNALGTGEASPSSEPFICGHTVAMEAPKFIGVFQDLAVPLGEEARFVCQVVALPTPEVSWFRNYREVFDGKKCTVEVDGVTHTLRVRNVDFTDAGDVECQARNRYGAVSIRAKLTVLAPAHIDLPPRYGEGLRFCRGDTIKVRVPITGTPAPEVTWLKDGKPVLKQKSLAARLDITGTHLHSTLILDDCIKSDGGVYTLEVKNELGSAAVDIPILVVEPPDPPTDLLISDIDKHAITLTWAPPEYDGGSPITGYVVERLDPSTGIWRYALSCPRPACTVACLDEHTEHKFRVMAENMFGVSEPSQASMAATTKEPVPYINYEDFYDSDFMGTPVDVNRIQGDVLGKYIICEELGRGAFGVVYRAIERATKKNWAAKFVRCRPGDKDLVRREIELMNSLHHPKLLQLHEAFDQTGEMVMILELLSGGELFDRLVAEDYDLKESDCIEYMRQVCQGVHHMHQQNIIHLDLKPENVMCVTKDSNDVKIIDFGLAQRVEEGKQIKVLFGTAEFCAPEIINFQPVSFSTDMWSLGVVTYVLLSGYSPFAGEDHKQTFSLVNNVDYDFDDDVWDSVSDDAKDFIKRLLIKDKNQRMTIDEALAHPWLNPTPAPVHDVVDGSAEKKLTGQKLSTVHHKDYRDRTKHKEDADDALPMGRLSRDSAVFRKEGDEGVLVRKLVMGQLNVLVRKLVMGQLNVLVRKLVMGQLNVLVRKLVMELPEHAPVVHEELADVTGFEGSRVQLTCKITGKPTPHIRWHKFDGIATAWFPEPVSVASAFSSIAFLTLSRRVRARAYESRFHVLIPGLSTDH